MEGEVISSNIYNIFSNILGKYDKKPNKESITDFIQKELSDSQCFGSDGEVKEVTREIIEAIDYLDSNYNSLSQFKSQGGSRDSWLKNKIESVIVKIPDGEQGSIIKNIKDALVNANNDIFEKLYKAKMPAESTDLLKSFSFKDLNATAIVQNLKKDIQNNTVLGAIVMEEGFKLKIDENHEEVKVVEDYLRSKIDDPEDSSFKKVLTSAAIISREKGFKPLRNISNANIAAIVDNGVTKVKLAYKLANGEISPVDVVEYALDRTTSTIGSIVTNTCQKIGANIGATVGGAIGSVFGPTGTAVGTFIGRAIGHLAGTAARTLIVEGVKKIATAAKNFVKGAWEEIKSIGTSIKEGILDFFGF